jgi:hypothetical protein
VLRRANKRFSVELKGEYSTHRFMWDSTGVTFQSLRGHHDDSSNQFADWLYQPPDPASYIPQESDVCQDQPLAVSETVARDGQPVELIVRSFKYVPTP